jgi:hypothetical protein
MLPRASVHDRHPTAGAARRALRAAAWWRSPSTGWFTVGHCATAGALQLTALCVGLAVNRHAIPSSGALIWAWLGLGVVASVAALLTVAALSAKPRTRRTTFAWTATIGLAYYAVLPALALREALWPIATLLPVAVAWHLTFARVPLSDPAALRGRRPESV